MTPEKDRLNQENIGLYGFYPNTFATKMIAKRIYNGVSATPNEPVYMQVEMKQHEFLNGAFYVFPFWDEKCIWDKTDKFWETAATVIDPVTTDKMFKEPNKVYTSAVNMPFYFPVAGINTVGFGEIIGLSSTTQALSEGQFGQYPLYAFTDEGIWALQTNENGGFASVTPVTRDIVNNADSITQIDDAILFSSNRGLMVLQGSQTQCLSEALTVSGSARLRSPALRNSWRPTESRLNRSKSSQQKPYSIRLRKATDSRLQSGQCLRPYLLAPEQAMGRGAHRRGCRYRQLIPKQRSAGVRREHKVGHYRPVAGERRRCRCCRSVTSDNIR